MRLPKHIGVIPDGNRRWAKEHGFNKEDGYSYGLDCGLRFLRAASSRGIKEITYYGFTVDNCKRPKEQVEAFTKACCDAVQLIAKEDVALFVVGSTDSACFPKALLPFTKRREKTGEKTTRVNFLVNYGWEWDIRSGLLSRDIPRIDLVIRFGGMCRLSGFLPMQTVYSDICVLKPFWPDFREEHLDEALAWYSRQDVTLGG